MTAERIAEEARVWFVRLLDDAVTSEEIAAWEAWLSRDPAHREAFESVSSVWRVGGLVAAPRSGVSVLAADRYDGTQPIAVWRARRRNWGPLLAAGIAALGLLLIDRLLFETALPTADAMTTARAEHRAETLADGSEIKIGAMSGLRVQIEPDRRLIHLDRGEVFFAVAHDTERPFVVKTELGSITAVGTAFDVAIGQDHLVLTVTEGAVVLRPRAAGLLGRLLNAEPVRVAAGQKLVVDASLLKPRLVAESAGSGVTWPDRRLEYRDVKLGAVIEDVNRYAKQPVILQDSSLGALLYTGTVELATIDRWVDALVGAFPVTVQHTKDGSSLLIRKKISE